MMLGSKGHTFSCEHEKYDLLTLVSYNKMDRSSKYILTKIYMYHTLRIDCCLYEGVGSVSREEVANICKAMSDSNRLKIIEMLTQGEKCGCSLLEELQVTQPTLSHHMKVLSDCGLVSSYKDGKWQHYSINCEKFKEYKDYIAKITCCENASKDCNSEKCC